MKKLFSVLTILSLVMFMAPISTHAVGTDWDVRGTYVWNVFGTYFHDFVIDVQDANGSFSGHAGYPAGGAPYDQVGQTTETVTGVVDGSNISFHVVYNGPYAQGSTFDMTGTIDSDGTISGTVPWQWSLDGHKAIKDTDHDGVTDGQDFCPLTGSDISWDESWGANRWQVQDGVWWQNKVKKGIKTPTASVNTIDYTYGCNGHQILEMLNSTFGSVMNGHLKYGLSSSVLEDFHKDLADGVLDGMYYLETVTVPANGASPVSSSNSFLVGHNYVLKASGTANAGDGIAFDADYSFRTGSSVDWTDAVSTYESYTDQLLDLKVNGGSVNWGGYSSLHSYSYEFAGLGSPVSFQVYDVYYPNNTGNLTVDIYAKI
ncbi:MAG: hypothetical protein AB201_01920 [Parcubacteria bacterium C7867-006]|nr:MAG: hypothetical protein AB201_01920 [Parcubacteria bacterium C7867-006]